MRRRLQTADIIFHASVREPHGQYILALPDGTEFTIEHRRETYDGFDITTPGRATHRVFVDVNGDEFTVRLSRNRDRCLDPCLVVEQLQAARYRAEQLERASPLSAELAAAGHVDDPLYGGTTYPLQSHA
jgi:hypothetical protein